ERISEPSQIESAKEGRIDALDPEPRDHQGDGDGELDEEFLLRRGSDRIVVESERRDRACTEKECPGGVGVRIEQRRERAWLQGVSDPDREEETDDDRDSTEARNVVRMDLPVGTPGSVH